MVTYTLTQAQYQWSAKKRHGIKRNGLRELIIKQKGRCALSGALLIFDKKKGTPEKEGRGCHPLYVAVDHIAPQSNELGCQLVCYDLNDLKGHLPHKLFTVLARSPEWIELMADWKKLADDCASDVADFRTLVWNMKKHE